MKNEVSSSDGGGLVADEALQHHDQAPRPLGKRVLGVLLQKCDQLGSDLCQHGGHVVTGQGVAVVQIHHCILQVAEEQKENDQERQN